MLRITDMMCLYTVAKLTSPELEVEDVVGDDDCEEDTVVAWNVSVHDSRSIWLGVGSTRVRDALGGCWTST